MYYLQVSSDLHIDICGNSYKGIDRNDDGFITKHGKRKAFHTGGNLSCQQHIHQHYDVYQQRCKESNIPEHHWAIPRAIWNKTKEKKKEVKGLKQRRLDELIGKPEAPFTRENVLHMVTQFVAVNDQVTTHQESNTKILITCG